MDYKERIEASIQEHLDAYMEIVKTLYDNPETEEHKVYHVYVTMPCLVWIILLLWQLFGESMATPSL